MCSYGLYCSHSKHVTAVAWVLKWVEFCSYEQQEGSFAMGGACIICTSGLCGVKGSNVKGISRRLEAHMF